MDKRPNIKKRIALELFRSIKKNRAKLHELRTLFWECTLRCNVSCRHCGSDCHVSASVPDMPVEDFLKVIDDITPYVEPNKVLVIFTGGEAYLSMVGDHQCSYRDKEAVEQQTTAPLQTTATDEYGNPVTETDEYGNLVTTETQTETTTTAAGWQ